MSDFQFTDPVVTRKKFEIELDKFISGRDHYRKLGVILLEAEYPNLYFGFIATEVNPKALVFAVKINFLNYDAEPLSVQFVDPLSFRPLMTNQVGTSLPRKLENSPQPQQLLQAELDNIPFFCIPGVREYHAHPFHNGDSWFLHRSTGVGTLCFLLDNLQLYGTSHIKAYASKIAVNFNFKNAGMLLVSEDLPL